MEHFQNHMTHQIQVYLMVDLHLVIHEKVVTTEKKIHFQFLTSWDN